jgi:hypothetical protein
MDMPRVMINVYIDESQKADLEAVKERDGVLVSEQIRRGIDLWLGQKGLKRRPSVPAKAVEKKTRG